MSDDLLDELLRKPVGPAIAKRPSIDAFTKEVSISGYSATVEIAEGAGVAINEGTALKFLVDEGQQPDDWEVSHFRKIEYGQGLSSVRFSFKRVGSNVAERALEINELIAGLENYEPSSHFQVEGDHGYLVLIGDMQFGKIDGDGPAGTLARAVSAINAAADSLLRHRLRFDIGHVHIAWLGDHIEGFVSQGGANVWRTPLTLNEQIRLTRQVMLHALKTFAPLASRVTMAAVPGNHGESVRFSGTGVTRYDDSHDTESLLAVRDAANLAPEAFGHVEFYVPDTDELTVVLDVAGTIVAHAHGHKWRPGKEMDWWRGQAFNVGSNLGEADLLVAGHLHHEYVNSDGRRLFIQVPALEAESTWWRHKTGTAGDPGIIVAVTKDGRCDVRETIHV